VENLAFYFNVSDPMVYVCRLLRKALKKKVKVIVNADESCLNSLDLALWNFSKTDFLPHCYLDADPILVSRSPILLTTDIQFTPHEQTLINLGNHVPEGFLKFQRVIEIVGKEEDELLNARDKWKHYKTLGLEITRYDLNHQTIHSYDYP